MSNTKNWMLDMARTLLLDSARNHIMHSRDHRLAGRRATALAHANVAAGYRAALFRSSHHQLARAIGTMRGMETEMRHECLAASEQRWNWDRNGPGMRRIVKAHSAAAAIAAALASH